MRFPRRPVALPPLPLWRPYTANETQSDAADTVVSGLKRIRSNWAGGGDTYYAWLHLNEPISGGYVGLNVEAALAKQAGANFSTVDWQYFLRVALIQEDWVPSTLTWNTQPAFGDWVLRADYEGYIDYGGAESPFFEIVRNWHPFRIHVPGLIYGLAVEIGTDLGSDFGCLGQVQTDLAHVNW